ncbi:histidine--tRNA ligase, chloroplastic/mitochondrial, partial [Tanacetum coccineum]
MAAAATLSVVILHPRLTYSHHISPLSHQTPGPYILASDTHARSIWFRICNDSRLQQKNNRRLGSTTILVGELLDKHGPSVTIGTHALWFELFLYKCLLAIMPDKCPVFSHSQEVSLLFGFEEVDYPVLETEALYIRKAGEEIRDQLYCFEDRGNRRVALRPELTPSLARLVIQKGKSVPIPIKWFAIGQCWRYERMTRGRRREHYQWNMDIIGVPDVTGEAELISSIVTFFKRIGITAKDVGFKISSRK